LIVLTNNNPGIALDEVLQSQTSFLTGDGLLFDKATVKQARAMILTLKDFGRKSGMEVNATKSEGFTTSSTNHVHKGSVWDLWYQIYLYSGRVMTHEEASSANISMRVRSGFLGGRLHLLAVRLEPLLRDTITNIPTSVMQTCWLLLMVCW